MIAEVKVLIRIVNSLSQSPQRMIFQKGLWRQMLKRLLVSIGSFNLGLQSLISIVLSYDTFDQLNSKVSMANNDSDSDEDKMKNENIKYCYFRLKGTSYISKTSKTQWAQS